MVVAVDASNIRAGGGLSHLVECLAALDPQRCGISSVIVYGSGETLCALADARWLRKVSLRSLQFGSLARFRWLHDQLAGGIPPEADILLVPGGSYLGSFRPFVVMAQNLLPFDSLEHRREGWSLKRLRLVILERLQGMTFRRADGVIYMSSISGAQIERRVGFTARRSRVVYHGLQSRFLRGSTSPEASAGVGSKRPLRLLYVSTVEPYKHQDVVISSVVRARGQGMNISLDLIGPATLSEAERLNAQIARSDPLGDFIRYHGPVSYEGLHEKYAAADAFVFASSCETFGIIILEAMAAGLPLICSHRSSMPEVAGSAAEYFDPLDPDSLVRSIARIYHNADLRHSLAFQSRLRATQFSWERCAHETFGFIREVFQESQRKGVR